MKRQLSLSSRPKTLDALVGQSKLVEHVRGLNSRGRLVTQWLLVGPSGCGKTTLARIMALSFQCSHGTFGRPCKECRRDKASFDIYELNASKVTGKENLESFLEGTEFSPRMGQRRVYILDECHFLSVNAQNSALKYLEDAPETTIFILCSTAPQKLIATIQSRCGGGLLRLRPLKLEDVTTYVTQLLTAAESDLPCDRLVDALIDRGVYYPRLIAQAVEKYVAGALPEDAADVEASLEIDTKALTRSLIKGDWVGVSRFMGVAETADIHSIRLGCLAYLRAILLGSTDISERTEAVAIAINTLVALQASSELVMSAGMVAALYKMCAVFSQYRH